MNRGHETSFNWKCWLLGHDFDWGFEYDDRNLSGLHSFNECLRCGMSDRIGKKFSLFNFLSMRSVRHDEPLVK